MDEYTTVFPGFPLWSADAPMIIRTFMESYDLSGKTVVPSAADPLGAANDSLILMRGGTFTMGSPDSEPQRSEDETAYEVTISDFFADPYEVTQLDYEGDYGQRPQPFQRGRPAGGQRNMV